MGRHIFSNPLNIYFKRFLQILNPYIYEVLYIHQKHFVKVMQKNGS